MSAIFSDGFESGNYSAWTNTAVDGTSTISIDGTVRRSGVNSSRSIIAGNGNDWAYCYKDITGQTVLYARTYFMLTALPANGTEVQTISFHGTGQLAVASIGVTSGGSAYIGLASRNGTTMEYNASLQTVSLNTWYALELYATVNASTGAYAVYFDNVQVISVSGKDSSQYGNITQVRFGAVYTDSTSGLTLRIDDCKIDDVYIGLEAFTDLTVTGNLTVGQSATINNQLNTNYIYPVGTSSNILVGTNLTVAANATINNQLAVQGNATFDQQLQLLSEVPQLTNLEIINDVFGFDNGLFRPDPLPMGASILNFRDTATNQSANMFLILSSENENAPLIATDQGFVIKKDLQAGGFISAAQGQLSLGGGLTSQVDLPTIKLFLSNVSRLGGSEAFNIPPVPSGDTRPTNPEDGQLFIWTVANPPNPANTLYKWSDSIGDWISMGPASDFAGTYDTLRLVLTNGEDPANMSLGTLYAEDAFVSETLNIAGTLNVANIQATNAPDPNIITTYSDIAPPEPNAYNLGNNTNYFSAVWANVLLYHTTIGSFDAIDDLAVLKKIKTIS